MKNNILNSMKNVCILILFTFSALSCFSKEEGKSPVMVVEKGKVFFTDTIQTNLTKVEMQSKMSDWLSNTFLPKRGIISLNDSISGIIYCQVLDYLEMEKNNWTIFAVYMRYSLIFQFQDNQCVIIIRNINYMDKEKIERGNYSSSDFIPGESVLIKKNYKEAFIKKAVAKKRR